MATGIHFNITGNARNLGRALSLAQRDMNHTMRESQRLNVSLRHSKGGFNVVSQGAVLVSSALKASSIAIVGMSIAVATASSEMISASAELETSVIRVAAVSTATEGQVGSITDRVLALGIQFGISGKSAAEAMTFLAMAGNTAEQSMSLVESSLLLATVGMIDAGRAADITTNILTGMRLESSDMDHVVDVLANTITSFNVNMTHMGDAFKYAAPLASQMHISVAELATTMGMLGNAGLQGEQGGTILRNMLQRLINPTGKASKIIKEWGVDLSEAAIKADGLSGIIEKLNDAGASAKDLSAVFGVRALSGVLALLDEGSERIEFFTERMERQGTAAEINSRIMATFEKRIASFKTQVSAASNVLATEWKDGLLVGLDLTEAYIEKVGLTDEALRLLGQEAFVVAIEGAIILANALGSLGQTTSFISDVMMLLYRVVKLVAVSVMSVLGAALVGLQTIFLGSVIAIDAILQALAMLPGASEAMAGSLESSSRNVEFLTQQLKANATTLEDFTLGANGAAGVVSDLSTKTGEFGRAADQVSEKTDRAAEALNRYKLAATSAFDAKNTRVGETSQIALNFGIQDHMDIAKAVQDVGTKNNQFLDDVQSVWAEGMDAREAFMLIVDRGGLDITPAQQELLSPTFAPAKKARKDQKDTDIKPRGRSKGRKKELDEMAMYIQALRNQGRERDALLADLDNEVWKNFMQEDLIGTETYLAIKLGLEMKYQDDMEKLKNEEAAFFDKIFNEAAKESEKAVQKDIEMKKEIDKIAQKMADKDAARRLKAQQANADYLIYQLQTFEAMGVQAQLQTILSDKEAEAQANFLTGEEAKAAAIQRSNEAILSQVGAIDQMSEQIGKALGIQLEYDKAMLSATADEKKILGQKRQIDLMNQVVELAPIVAQVFGASAKQQLIVQTILNAVMAVGQLATMNYIGALGSFLSAGAGVAGLAAMDNLQTQPQINEETASANRQQTTQAIIEALKEAGLYQRERRSVTVNQTGNDPINFTNRTRQSRNTNARQLRTRRERV